MSERRIHIAIIGCGNIASQYADDLAVSPEIELVGVTDLVLARAEALAAKHGCRVYPTARALLDDRTVELVVNLTVYHAHYFLTRQCLASGKSAYSEKPLAMTYPEAQSLVRLAREKGLRLGCSPFTFLGEAQQTAWKWIREGRLGPVRMAYAEVNWGRIESWHPAPEPFYEAGPLFDVGVYPLTVLTTIFGPARRVQAFGRVLYPERVTQGGVPFRVKTPDFTVVMVEFKSGTLARLTSDFYVHQQTQQKGIEFHGDIGSLYLESWLAPGSNLAFAEFGQPYRPVPLAREPLSRLRWGTGVRDVAEAILHGQPQRVTGEQAAHIVEILCAASESMQKNAPVRVASDFPAPAPMEWAE